MRSLPEHLIDACVTQLNNGKDLEAVLAAHPEHADQLRPILAAAAWVRVEIPAPRRERRLEGKRAVMAAAVRRRRQVDAAQGYLNEIAAGVPVAELLERAQPAERPMIVAAYRMQATEAPTPDPDRRERDKARLMAMVAERRAEQRHSQRVDSAVGQIRAGLSGLGQGLTMPRPGMLRRAASSAVALGMTALVIGFSAAGLGTAAADSLPGDAFYQVKRLGENARLLFAIDPSERQLLDEQFGAERLAEMLDLAAQGRELPNPLVAEWAGEQHNVFASVRRLPLADQISLADALGAGDLDALAQNLGQRNGTDSLVAWLAERIAAEQAAKAPQLETPDLPVTLDRAPMLAPRPLPVEAPVEDEKPAAVAQPEPAVEEPAAEEPGELIMALPLLEEEEDRANEDEDEDNAAVEEPVEEAAADEPVEEDPDEFVLPPLMPEDPDDSDTDPPDDPEAETP